MIRIKIHEIQKHRNETTFRPFLSAQDIFRDVGIRFVFAGDKFDINWIGQATFCDKNAPLYSANDKGSNYINKHVDGDYILFDGQDSASLIGDIDIWDKVKKQPTKFFKNSFYADWNEYYRPSPHGRIYWDRDNLIDFKVQTTIESNKYELSGCNWLSTITPNWFKYSGVKKEYDVFALFSFPGKVNFEFTNQTNYYYDFHRRKCINWLDKLPTNIKIATLTDGQRVPIDQYYQLMSRSKIVVAPFGYGEMAPRDIESAMVGSILIKPDMSHIQTNPNIFIPNKTYVPVKWDFSDMNEKILELLENYDEKQEFFVENMRAEYANQYNPTNLVLHTYNWLKTLDGIGTI